MDEKMYTIEQLRKVKGIGEATIQRIVEQYAEPLEYDTSYREYQPHELDYWDDDTWLMHGDCLERMREMPDGSVDMIVVDPPYEMTKRGKSCRPNWMPSSMGNNVFRGEIPDVDNWTRQCYRVLGQGHIYIFTNTVSVQKTLNSMTQSGFKLHNIISMIKDTGMPNRWYYKQTELVLFMRKGGAIPINDYTSRDNIKVTMPKKKDGKLHITEKPLEFIEKLVKNSSIEAHVVLDPFMGSGTTGVAARNLNRKFIGIELDETYYKLAKGRILNGDK
jgi:site-specific DNA-methyltransferase (adenine-specific)